MTEIFKNTEVFREDYVPSRILFREEQFKQINATLRDVESGGPVCHCLGIGDMGTGKTLCFKYAYARLPPKYHVYVNCSDAFTQSKILVSILQNLGSKSKPGCSTYYYWKELKALLPQQKFLLVTLDEIDKFVEHPDSGFSDFFYNISRPPVQNVLVSMLTNSLRFESKFRTALDPRSLDTFPYRRLEFPDYSVQELTAILSDRFRDGLQSTAYDEDTVHHIAAIAYKEHLRARGMIKLAFNAAQKGESNHETKIQNEHIKTGLEELDVQLSSEIIKRLHLVQIDLLGQISRCVKIPSKVLFEKHWPNIAKYRDTGTSFQRYWSFLSPMIVMGLVQEEKNGRGRGKGVQAILTIPGDAQEMIAATLQTIENERKDRTISSNWEIKT